MDALELTPAPASTPAMEPLELDDGTATTPLYPETIERRSQKFSIGLGELLQKTKDQIYTDISQGNEGILRETAASEVDKRKYDALQSLLVETANRKGGPLSNEEKLGLSSIVAEMSVKTDPGVVLETAYGKQLIAQLEKNAAGSRGNNVLDKAIMEDPAAVAKIMNDHSTLIAKNQVIDTLLEDARDAYKNQSWFSWGIDQGKSLIPGYTDYMMRGNVQDVGVFAGLGMGANLQEQRRNLLQNTPEDLHTKLKAISDRLKESDPSMAVKFLEHMRGVSYETQFAANVQAPIEFGTTATAGKLAKKGISAVRGTATKDLEKAASDVARAATDPNASKSTIEAASGNLTESAVTRATADATAELSNAPVATKKAIEGLSTTYRTDIENIRANPGHLGQDIVNRIAESSNNLYRQFVDMVVNTQKVERLPEVLANETTVRAVIEGIKDTYRGLKNTVLDVSKPYKEPVSNTYLVDLYVGQNDGTYFKNRKTAENFLERYGLSGEIGQGADAKYTKANVEITKINKNISGAEKIIERETVKVNNQTLTEEARAKAQEQIDTAREYINDQTASRDTWRAAQQTATVEQQGMGYYIKITKPIDETQPVIRQALAQTADTKIPDSPISSFINSWFGKARTPEEVLSKAERQNRLTATYAPSEYINLMIENAKEIQKLQAGRFSKGRKRWEEWQRGLENAQELPDPTDPTKKGYFFSDPADMDHYWQQWFHRLPDAQETAAYFEFKRGMEFDRMFRNLAEHRNQQRVGAETIRVVTKNADGTDAFSPKFSGVVRKKIPGSQDNILVMGDNLGEEKVLPLERQTSKWEKEVQDELDKGIKVLIEVYAPELKPLNGFGNLADSRVRYVLANIAETKPLEWEHIPRRGGGHIQYDHDWYIKQAKVKHDDVGNRYWYEGDTTIMAIMNRGVGDTVAKHLDQVRKLIKADDFTAAQRYSDEHLHMDWDQVRGWFKGGKNHEGKYEPARLDLDEEIRVVPRNRKIVDIDNNLRNRYTNFKDGSREGSLSRQNRVEFAEERDGYTLLQADMEGTKANPLYKISSAKAVDPITTMNRGLERIVRSNFMEDYKTMAVEHWLRQAAPYLDVHSTSEIYGAPYYYFNEGKFRIGTPAEIQARLEASKYHTQQLTGQPSLVDDLLHSAAQRLSDMSVNVAGPKGQIVVPDRLMPFLRDPIAFARSAAFHMKLGLFNIPQLIVQMGNYSNILGIAGYKYATPGTLGAQMHFFTNLNRHPNILNHLDSLASKFNLPGTSGWKPGEFKEAFEELGKTGFGNVKGEHAALDNMMANKVVTSGYNTFLDWGQTPFKLGEQNARYGAWYTAFKEFRDRHPTGRITDADRAEILQRADLLNVNMSRASSSMLNKGVWSIPTQFYTYQMRLFELFFGSRLTATERARMFGVNATLYGIPMATGLTGLPVADYIRQKAMEEGYVVGEDYMKSMFMEGLPSALGALITGKGDPQAGTWYDVGPRFGTKGFEFLGGLSKTDKGYLDMLGGPVYSIVKGTITQTDGFARAMISMAKRDQDVFPMTVEDIIDPLKEITTVNTAWRDYAIMSGGRWVSKNDAYLADASGWNAFVNTFTGLKDQEINDIQTMRNSLKKQAEYETEIENRFRQEFRRGVLAQKDNPEMAKKFFTRAQAWLEIGGYREDRISSLVSRAISDNQSVVAKLNWDFYIKKVPDAQATTRYDAFKRNLQIQDKKRGE